MAKKKDQPFKKTGLKEKFQQAYGKMKSERSKERAAEREECGCGGKGCKKCNCG